MSDDAPQNVVGIIACLILLFIIAIWVRNL